MLDPTTIKIEELYQETGSYIEAFIEFTNKFQIYDYEDVLAVINPIYMKKLNRNLRIKISFLIRKRKFQY